MRGLAAALGLLLALSLTTTALADVPAGTDGTVEKTTKIKDLQVLKLKEKDVQPPDLDLEKSNDFPNTNGYSVVEDVKQGTHTNTTSVGSAKLDGSPIKKNGKLKKNRRKKIRKYFSKPRWKRIKKRKNAKRAPVTKQSLGRNGKRRFPRRKGRKNNLKKWGKQVKKKKMKNLIGENQKQVRNLKTNTTSVGTKRANKIDEKAGKWKKRNRKKVKTFLSKPTLKTRKQKRVNTNRGSINQQSLNKKGQGTFPRGKGRWKGRRTKGFPKLRKRVGKNKADAEKDRKVVKQIRNLSTSTISNSKSTKGRAPVKPRAPQKRLQQKHKKQMGNRLSRKSKKLKSAKGKTPLTKHASNKRKRFRQKVRKVTTQMANKRKPKKQRYVTKGNNREAKKLKVKNHKANNENILRHLRDRIRAVKKSQRHKKKRQGNPGKSKGNVKSLKENRKTNGHVTGSQKYAMIKEVANVVQRKKNKKKSPKRDTAI